MSISQRLVVLIILSLSYISAFADNSTGNKNTLSTSSGDRHSIPVRSETLAKRLDRININAGGKVCYSRPDKLLLSRQDNDSVNKENYTATWMLIQNTATSHQIKLAWQLEQVEQAWPKGKMPVKADVNYILSQPDGTSKEVFLYQLPDDLMDNEAQQQWMQNIGCL
ncbi:hypothetical protein QUF61_14425 [Candidatus Venteria ishoeyi]|uniref:hypothetical protein n=1 Tax=Candidatus Venteria ishoeyi TaxID=1899563 RepID=UPI0025A59521|nr:hypothetical protein [Candidatus Venteria ishoeyi]MDM8547684.1 hypothetical protein [Candidatus Venteria ishoeyi]